jgi:C1A family cysteine protease
MTEDEVDMSYGDCAMEYDGGSAYDYDDDGASSRTDDAAADLPLPEQVDWRLKGAVTSVKNQGGCRACWAFAAIAAVEGINAIKTGNLTDLSEQALIDCGDGANRGCKGGLASEALLFMSSQGRQNGSFLEDAYPFR